MKGPVSPSRDKPPGRLALLRLLRRRLFRQWRFARDGHLEEAAALADSLAATLAQLEELPPESETLTAGIYAQCLALNQAVGDLLQRESRLLGREIVESQLERELRRLREEQK